MLVSLGNFFVYCLIGWVVFDQRKFGLVFQIRGWKGESFRRQFNYFFYGVRVCLYFQGCVICGSFFGQCCCGFKFGQFMVVVGQFLFICSLLVQVRLLVLLRQGCLLVRWFGSSFSGIIVYWQEEDRRVFRGNFRFVVCFGRIEGQRYVQVQEVGVVLKSLR